MRTALPVLLVLACTLAQAAEPAREKGTVIELSAEASRTAPNDLAQATVYAEASDAKAGEAARRVNIAIAQALATSKAYPGVKARSGGSHTWPAYDKGGKINGWRMRSEIQLESRDIPALSELLGKLQSSLAVSQINLVPAPDTRRKAEDGAMLDAMDAFQARARLAGEHLRKTWRIRHMSIGNGGGRVPFQPMMARAAAISDAAAPMPVEAGDTQVTVTVTGQIELSE